MPHLFISLGCPHCGAVNALNDYDEKDCLILCTDCADYFNVRLSYNNDTKQFNLTYNQMTKREFLYAKRDHILNALSLAGASDAHG